MRIRSKKLACMMIAFSLLVTGFFSFTGSTVMGAQDDKTPASEQAESTTQQAETTTQQAGGDATKDANAPTPAPEKDPTSGMEVITQNRNLVLYFNKTTYDLAVKVIANGDVWYTNPNLYFPDTKANESVQNDMASQVKLEYYNAKNESIYLNSKLDSVDRKQVEFKKIDNGIKITYTLGKKDDKRVVPKLITKERFDALVEKIQETRIKKLMSSDYYRLLSLEKEKDDKKKQELLEKYPVLANGDIYEIRSKLTDIQLNGLEKAVIAAGYTLEDVQQDHKETNFEGSAVEQAFFTIPVEFTLEEDSFVATVKADEIQKAKNFALYKMSLLENFGAAPKTATGYMLVPDGSGALIELNKPKGLTSAYTQPLYGADDAISQVEKKQFTEQSVMPVFGMKQDEKAFFAVVEKGDAAAEIKASASGNISAYNSIYTEYTMSSREYVRFGGLRQAEGMSIFPKQILKGDIRVRYTFFHGEDANYMGMAKWYQDYLVQQGALTKLTPKEDIPMIVEVLGAIEKKKQFLGFPIKTMQPLTSFSQAQEMVEEITAKNINNVKLRYTAWFNNGLNNYLHSKINIDKGLGGADALNALNTYIAGKGFELYPDANFQYVYQKKSFDGFNTKADTARFLTKSIASVSGFSAATYIRTNTNIRYPISPKQYDKFIGKFLGNYKKFDIAGLSVGTMGRNLNSDFNEENIIDREKSKEYVIESLKKVKDEGYKTLVEVGNAYTLPYASAIVNIPLDSSRFAVEDESIPFYQMVLHGYVEYAGEPLNLAQDYKRSILKSVESGAGIYYKWIYGENTLLKKTDYENMFSLNYKSWINDAAEIYNRVNNDLKHVQGQRIVGHSKLAPDVYKTQYEDGTRVIVNYNTVDVDVDGTTVKAEDYQVMKGGR